MGIGMLIVVFGPLLILPIIWIVARGPLNWLIGKWINQHFGSTAWLVRLIISAILVSAVVSASYLPGHKEFIRLCVAHEPIINEVVDVPGFYATKLSAYEAEPLLRQLGFTYVEAPDIYNKGRTLRYALNKEGKTVTTNVQAPVSRYAVSNTYHELGNTIELSEKRIFELSTGRELAHAGRVTYHGGYLNWLLGIGGLSDCPDTRTEKGAQQFNDYSYLERKVLKSSFVQEK